MQTVIDAIAKANSFVNNIVWGWPAIILILLTGILLTIRTKFLQVTKFGDSMKSTIGETFSSVGSKKKNKPGISPFAAFASAISGTVGTGNIIGVTSAILTGGPGAVFWMWISAFFGMVTNYSENALGLYYRKKDENGNFKGGAFYYIENGVKWKWLAYVASVFCLMAALAMGGVQTNKISGTITDALGQDSMVAKLIVGIVVAALTAIIIIGGIKRISKVATLLVPFMSLIFIILAIIGIFMNIKNVPEALKMIFTNAFTFKAAGGGIMGYGFAMVIRKGMARGIFSNEAGLGSSVIAHSATDNREPVKQGLWGIFEVFFDTFVICTLTALLLLTTFNIDALNGAFDASGTALDAQLAVSAFNTNFSSFGVVCFSIILPLFAFTTIMAWAYYGEKAMEFTFQWTKGKGQKIAVLVFKIIYVLFIVLAAVINSDLVWDLSDTANGLMAIPNLIALIILSGQVVKLTKNYYDRKKGKDVLPMLSAYPEINQEFIEYEIKHNGSTICGKLEEEASLQAQVEETK